MKFFAFLRSMPQPVQSFYYLFAASILFVFFASASGGGAWTRLPLGISGLLFGLTLVTNFKGNASQMAKATSQYRPMGVDYSKSIMATPRYARFFGGCMTFVGLAIIASSL